MLVGILHSGAAVETSPARFWFHRGDWQAVTAMPYLIYVYHTKPMALHNRLNTCCATFREYWAMPQNNFFSGSRNMRKSRAPGKISVEFQ